MRSSKPTYVLNATPVLHFSKIGKLNLILETCNALVTKEAYSETVIRDKNFLDSLAIKEAVESGRLKVYEVKGKNAVKALLKYGEIHEGEAETIVAAKELGGTAIIDDKEARVIAEAYNVKAVPGCLFLLFRLLKLRKIDTSETKNMLEQLIKSGLYLDPETLLKACRRIAS